MEIDRRSRIMDAAEKSFALFGYKATTMDQVAKLANVGKGTIYNFFKNKEELFDHIIQQLIAEMKETAETSIQPDSTFFDNINRALFNLLEFRKKHQLTIKLFQEEKEIGTPAVQEVMYRLERTIISFIKIQIQKAIEKEEIKACDPEITAFAMMKLYISLIFDWEKNHQPLEKEQIANLFQLYFLEGLSNR